MQCILIFDQLNDILFSKCNKKFLEHCFSIAKTQGLISDFDSDEPELTELSSNVVIQLFSPIITSQRFMACQFSNSYTSIQCEGGVNLVFNEYMGYLFVYIGVYPVAKLKRTLATCISFVKHLCGPNVPILKYNKPKSNLLSNLMDTWFHLFETDQAVLVEAVEQLFVNSELSGTIFKALQDAVDKLPHKTDYSRIHGLVMVKNKFVSLYSSRSAEDILPADIMFLGFLGEALSSKEFLTQRTAKQENSDSELSYCLFNANVDYPIHGVSLSCTKENFEQVINGMHSFVILLTGYHPYAVRIGRLAEDVYLFLLFECGNGVLSLGLSDAFLSFNALQNMQMQKDVEGVRQAFEFLDSAMKKIFDGLRKLRNKGVEVCQKNLQSKWEYLRKKYIEFLKNPDSECIAQIESSSTRFVDCLKLLLEVTCLNEIVLLDCRSVVESTFLSVKNCLKDFSDFLQVKALRNFTLGSRASLTINKYLEEFPGLVHFIYIDRHFHRLTAPSLDFTLEESAVLTKKQLWSLIDFSRSHLRQGRLSMMWKDRTFNYSYFLWFENTSGSPLKPKIYPTTALKNFPPPGIIVEDFYKRLIEVCFPKVSPSKIRCYELFCIHLGLATSSCVLEHSRRLAATIWEVTGIPSNPADFL